MSYKSDNPNLERHLENCSSFSALIISKLEDENELLREQLETLKQQLRLQCNLNNTYLQQLKDTEDELKLTNHELSTALRLEMLGLDEAKELANIIVESNNFVSESLAELLTAIYGSLVKPEELEHNKSSITTKALKGAEENKIVAKSKELRAESEDLQKLSNELGTRFVGFLARFMRQKAQFSPPPPK